jgi:hypothetical protein
MKFAVLSVLTILALDQTMAVANSRIKGTHVRYMQVVETKTPASPTDPVTALHAPIGPTDSDYGNVPNW